MKFSLALLALVAFQPCHAKRSWLARLLTVDTSGDGDLDLNDSAQKHLREPSNLGDYYPSHPSIERRTMSKGGKGGKGKGNGENGVASQNSDGDSEGKSSKGKGSKGKSSKEYNGAELSELSDSNGKGSKGKSSKEYDGVELTEQAQPCPGTINAQANSGKMYGGKMDSNGIQTLAEGGKMYGGKMYKKS